MFKKWLFLSVLLLAAVFASAQEPEQGPLPFHSVKEATGEAFLPVAGLKHGGGEPTCQPSDGKPHAWKSAGVVIAEANTDRSGNTFCTMPDEEIVISTGGGDFVFWRAPLHRLIFKPKNRHPDYLEVVWSGQVNVYPGFTHPLGYRLYQTAFLECTVTQKGCTVPCSGADLIPAIAQDSTEKGLSEWVTYHGYVEINPKHDVTVELWLWAWPWESKSGLVNACGDTVILKY